jgi:hypothetical protein
MRDLLRNLEEAREIHVPIKELPDSLRAALKRVGYGSRDIGVVAQDKVDPNPYAAEGQKGFVQVIDIASGRSRDLEGSWGGASPNNPSEIDFANRPVPIPEGGAVIIGVQGYPQTMATIYVHPKTIAAMLPPAAETTEREQTILRTIRSLNSAGRKEVFGREKVTPAEIDALVARGLLKKTKTGAVSITTDGKNVAEGQEDGMRDLLRRLEEEEVASPGFATRKDIVKHGYQGEDFKVGVPAVVKKLIWKGQADVDRALKEGGVFTFRRGFFYRHGTDGEKFAASTAGDLTKAGFAVTLLASGENWAAFSGGASEWSAKSSFFWAIFQVRTGSDEG